MFKNPAKACAALKVALHPWRWKQSKQCEKAWGPAVTFAEKFCVRNKLPTEAFEATVLRFSLKRRARVMRWVLSLNPNYFVADREFVRSVGRISRMEDFHSEALDFHNHPSGQGFCHRVLGLRVSKKRLRHLLRVTLAHR